MVACFLVKTGHVATVRLEHRRTVNSEWYTTICLPKVFGDIRKTNKRRRIIVHNASSHIAAQISAILTGQNLELMGHSPYSPDLEPNDPIYSRTSRKKMRGQRLPSPEDTVGVFKNHVLEMS